MFQQVLNKYPDKVKLVVKHFPLRNHKFARNAAMAALAAERQQKFWEFHHELFKNYRALNDAKIQEIAKALGLDMEKFNRDVNLPEISNLINQDLLNGNQVGVRGTPTIFINGKLLANRSLDGFSDAIEAELKKKK